MNEEQFNSLFNQVKQTNEKIGNLEEKMDKGFVEALERDKQLEEKMDKGFAEALERNKQLEERINKSIADMKEEFNKSMKSIQGMIENDISIVNDKVNLVFEFANGLRRWRKYTKKCDQK